MNFFDKVRKNFLKLNLAQQISIGVLVVCVPLVITLSVNAINNSIDAMEVLKQQEIAAETTPAPTPTATPEATPEVTPSPSPTPDPKEIFLKPSSVEEDLEVQIVDAKGNMVTGYPFLLTVIAEDGSYNRQWTVDDGFLRLTKISSGEYTVTIDEAEGYIIKETTIQCTVEKKVEYEEIDVSDKVVDESEIDVKQEDAALSKPIETPSATPVVPSYKDQLASKKTTPAVYRYKADLVEDPLFTEKNVGYLKGSDKKYVIKLDNDGYIVDFKLAPADTSAAAVSQTDINTATAAMPVFFKENSDDGTLLNTYTAMSIMPLTLNVGSIITTENTGDADATPSPTPAATATPTAEPTATPTAEPTATPTPTPTPTPSPTPEATATPTPSPSPTAAVTPSPSPSATPEATPSPTPEASPSASPDATPTVAPSVSPSAEPTPSPTPVPTPVTYRFESLEKATDIYENGQDGKLKAAFITNHGIADESTPEKIAYSNGWKDKKKEYYYDSKGKLIKGQANIGGVVYTFDNNGKRIDEGKIAKGIDVSKWQGNIDWKAVKASGVDYAIIRVGYRGYGSGALVEDPYFRQNIQGATAAGLKVGVYFFSQAVTTAEAVEEASMAIKAVKGYKLHYPIYFDTEAATLDGSGRADRLGSGQRTDIANAFCQTVKNSGYKAGVYASKSWFQYNINYSTLSKYDIWLAHYTTTTDFAHRYDMWQYTGSGSCPGVSGGVDLNWAYKVY